MNMGKKITELRETTAVPGESRYPVSMGDGTGVKQVKHSTLVEQLKTDMGMTYDETMEMLRATDEEGNKKVPDVKAVSDWIASKITNNLLTTEQGFFLDARQGKALNDKINQINSNLAADKSNWKQVIIDVKSNEEYVNIQFLTQTSHKELTTNPL